MPVPKAEKETIPKREASLGSKAELNWNQVGERAGSGIPAVVTVASCAR